MIAREEGTRAQEAFIPAAMVCADALGALRKERNFDEPGWGAVRALSYELQYGRSALCSCAVYENGQ
jgi:hypothetical protein